MIYFGLKCSKKMKLKKDLFPHGYTFLGEMSQDRINPLKFNE
jgi:hypothetical protein